MHRSVDLYAEVHQCREVQAVHLWLSGVDKLTGTPQAMDDRDVKSMSVIGGRKSSGEVEEAVYFTWDDKAQWLAALVLGLLAFF